MAQEQVWGVWCGRVQEQLERRRREEEEESPHKVKKKGFVVKV